MLSERDPGRYEYKYALPVHLRPQILDLLGDHVVPDPHVVPLDVPHAPGAQGYLVHSLYFDTPQLDDYAQRINHRVVRDRLRARTYGHPGQGQPVFVENKRKQGTRVVKNRARVCTADDWAATPGPSPWRPWVKRLTGAGRYPGRHFDRLVRGRRVPVTVVHYAREIFVGRRQADTSVRVNMDFAITITPSPAPQDLYAPGRLSVLPDGWMVFEMKFNETAPGWMRRLARTLRLQAEPVSKFGLGIAHAHRAQHRQELRFFTPRHIRPLLYPQEAPA